MKRATSLKLKRYMSKVKTLDDNNFGYHMFHILIISFGILALVYVLILGNMVFNIIERRSIEKEILSLSNEVGVLELSYLSLSSKVDLNLARTLGFKEIKPKFAIRQTFVFNSSLNIKLDNEI